MTTSRWEEKRNKLIAELVNESATEIVGHHPIESERLEAVRDVSDILMKFVNHIKKSPNFVLITF